MKILTSLLLAASLSSAGAQDPAAPIFRLTRDIPYAEPANPRQMLDVYSPLEGEKRPVVIWIHGGGWQTGDKINIQNKPAAFVEQGFVFVSISHRFVPQVPMENIVRDVAKSVAWVRAHIHEHRGDPDRLFIMGHSSGAQLAALICTDDGYLKAEGVPFPVIKGCVPVDGDTYDIPLQIATAQARRKSLGQPNAKFGHPEKFGSPELQQRFSAVNHVAKGKHIPPFLILHVATHADTTTQAGRLASTLTASGISAQTLAVEDTDHSLINRNLGLPNDTATPVLFEFIHKLEKEE
ncbi:acetyl esterase/lipase [Prosthecobacter fusiformis]|uniref:Acetyl esterase/lipase n=1 Tax=Prosthecobacter fusiformis TaxID=48464 RepID=A0A4R7S6G6_9BACT|nr:alpha/beta hydrolase [Prosthecobacter fusiformis]TDU72787.1 acetyl esterase/lipase [Prosthecobacter fusiformis]